MTEPEYRVLKESIAKFERSNARVENWLAEQDTEGFKPLTYEVVGEFLIFYVVKELSE